MYICVLQRHQYLYLWIFYGCRNCFNEENDGKWDIQHYYNCDEEGKSVEKLVVKKEKYFVGKKKKKKMSKLS